MNATTNPHSPDQRGFSLVELMIAMTIGLVIVAGLTTVFVTSSQSHRELQKSVQQIENGRYAMDLITQDLHHAGYYGDFYDLRSLPVPAAMPDPCEKAIGLNIQNAMALPVQGYNAGLTTYASSDANFPLSSCAPLSLPDTNLMRGSDILVVRRAQTMPIGATDPAPLITPNEVYLQASSLGAQIQFGVVTGFALGNINSTNAPAPVGTTAGGTAPNGAVVAANLATPIPLLKVANYPGTPLASRNNNPRIAADIRKFNVHVYFVAPCSVPSVVGDLCTGAADDGGRPIPTLKRLELTAIGGVTKMNIVPLVEGVENLQIEYGIDDTAIAPPPPTGYIGDGVPDRFTATPSAVDLTNAVAVNVYLLARNIEPTPGYVDSKTYTLGSPTAAGSAGTTTATSDPYKRHVYSASVRLVNPSSRREIP